VAEVREPGGVPSVCTPDVGHIRLRLEEARDDLSCAVVLERADSGVEPGGLSAQAVVREEVVLHPVSLPHAGPA